MGASSFRALDEQVGGPVPAVVGARTRLGECRRRTAPSRRDSLASNWLPGVESAGRLDTIGRRRQRRATGGPLGEAEAERPRQELPVEVGVLRRGAGVVCRPAQDQLGGAFHDPRLGPGRRPGR